MRLEIIAINGEYSILKSDVLPDMGKLEGFFALMRTNGDISLFMSEPQVRAVPTHDTDCLLF